jgi:hypothetical protein
VSGQVMEKRPSTRRALAGVAIFAAAGACLGQAGPWSMNGPEGGSVYCIVRDPFAVSTLYAGTRHGVVRSTDGGASWQASAAGMPSVKVTTIAADSTTPGTLYAGTRTDAGVESVGIFKSTDGAATWTAVNSGLVDTSTGISPVDVLVLAIDPGSPGNLLAGTSNSDIFKSTDGGATWHAETTGGSAFGFAVTAFQFLPGNSAIVYAASNEGLLRSPDGGVTWLFYGNEGDSLSTLLIDPRTPTTMYAGSADGAGVLKSTDGGNNFKAINKNLPVNQDSAGTYSPLVLSMTFDPGSSSVLLGTYGNGLFKSSDASTWSAAGTGVRDLYVSALAPPGGSSPALLAGVLEGGIYLSTDGAQTWTMSSAGLAQSNIFAFATDPASPGTAYAATFDGVRKTTDSGLTWREADSGIPLFTVTALALSPGGPATLFAASNGGGLLTSTDGGATWSAVSSSTFSDKYVSSVVVDPTNPATLYAGTDHPYNGNNPERLFKSTNGGSTWTQTSLNAAGSSVDIVAVNPAQNAQVFAASHGTSGLFQSLDGGVTWTTLNTDPACGGVNTILFDASGQTMYLATTTGVCRSTDGARTWALSSVANLASVQALCFDPLDASILYAGAMPLTIGGSGGVFASSDGGATWAPVGSGLPADIPVSTLAADGKAQMLYAGTQGSGVATLALLTGRARVQSPGETHRPRLVSPR